MQWDFLTDFRLCSKRVVVVLCCADTFRLSLRVTGCCAKYASIAELPSIISTGCPEGVSTGVDIISSHEYSCGSYELSFTEGSNVAKIIEKALWCQFR